MIAREGKLEINPCTNTSNQWMDMKLAYAQQWDVNEKSHKNDDDDVPYFMHLT